HYYTGPAEDWSNKPVLVFFACVSTPFFGTTGLLSLLYLVRRQPILIIDATGIEVGTLDRVSLRWSEVSDVCETGYGRNTFLAIELHNPDYVLSRLPVFARVLARINVNLMGTNLMITISDILLGLPLDDVICEARKHLPRP